ncbi:hypothetical protein SELMODRAFT_421604 [Selaginella moellendorffii]|uniref:Uncharacterized protein n=1 Tax=Selaginella moellendorffii TaxID=88036 RepID=D8SFS7_SELML|nr:hypothetical protein SELMODRAFT_421604 [Selaginella moellendorffii]
MAIDLEEVREWQRKLSRAEAFVKESKELFPRTKLIPDYCLVNLIADKMEQSRQRLMAYWDPKDPNKKLDDAELIRKLGFLSGMKEEVDLAISTNNQERLFGLILRLLTRQSSPILGIDVKELDTASALESEFQRARENGYEGVLIQALCTAMSYPGSWWTNLFEVDEI